MRLVSLAIVLASLTMPTRAQTFGSCETGTAQGFIENSELRASVFNTGGLFFGGSTTSGNGYLIPKASGNSPFLAAGFWLAGTVDGDPRVAAARYGGYDFWPGPLDDAENPPDDCSAHDRIYVVSKTDIAHYYATGELADDLADWPYQLGAPVIDGDDDPTNYDLRAGDQPDLIGDVAAWWVMNDAGNDHNPGSPLGVEVRVLAFVYGGAEDVTPSPVLTQTTFIRFEIVNRREQPITDMYAAVFADPDLGDAGDDYVGADTLRHMGFVYNHSNVDAIYGPAPPAQGIQVLQGAIVEGDTLGMTSASVFDVGPSGTQEPGTPEEYRFFMQGLWGNGTPYYEIWNGFEQPSAPTTRFMYAGNPVTESFYSEVNIDGVGTDSSPGDRRFLVSSGPFTTAPGASQTLLIAFPYARGSSHLQSIAVLQGRATVLLRAAASGAFDTGQPVDASALGPAFELALSKVHPNPSRQPEAVLTLPETTPVRATVYDALGRQIEVIAESELAEGETVLTLPSELAPGTYLLHVEVPGATETLPFIIVR